MEVHVRTSAVLLLVLAGCEGVGGNNKAIAGDCGDVCPDGTRKASFDAVVRGSGVEIIGEECETICEGIVPCTAPNVPTVTESGDYSCDPLEGYVAIEPDSEVDFGWADGWVQP